MAQDAIDGPRMPGPASDPPPPPAKSEESSDQQAKLGPLEQIGDLTSRRAKNVFHIWMVVFALVGAQMSWILRPFIGNPEQEFQWFRQRDSNFFEAVRKALERLLGG